MATIDSGVNAIQASNWRGKSSLIAAIETVLGTKTPLTEGQDRGRVELDTGEETLIAELIRRGNDVIREGDVLLPEEHDRVCAELFAVLGERNELRRAVREGENLEAPLTRPLDLENIDERIAELRHEREAVDRELEQVKEAAAQLPEAQERVTRLESELASLRDERDALAGGEGADAELESIRETLSEKRAARDRTASTIERLEEQIASIEATLEEREDEVEELDVPDESDVEADLQTARDELSAVESEVDLLKSVYNANRRVVEEERVDLLTTVDRGIDDDAVECWVCGETSEREAFEDRLDGLSEEIADRRRHAQDLRDRVESLEVEHRQIAEKRRRALDLEDEVERLSTRLDDRRGDLAAATDRLDELTAAVESLEAEVEGVDEQLTDVESEIKYVEAELEDATAELDELDGLAERREGIEATREEIASEIEELRTRRDRKRREAREAFEASMATVLNTFEPGFESARLTSSFDLVVARDGREVGIDALSEGEVELLGIVAALAGYETFDVSRRVPVILLDGLGGLAAENLHRLIEYLDDRAEYLVTTAYPEQGGYEWNAISPKDWQVVSDGGPPA